MLDGDAASSQPRWQLFHMTKQELEMNNKVNNKKLSHPNHKIYLTNNSADKLIEQIQDETKTNNRVVVVVTSNAMIGPAKRKLDKFAKSAQKKISVSIFTTLGYVYFKEHGASYQYDENAPPWKYSAKKISFDETLDQGFDIKAVKRRVSISKTVFPTGNTSEAQVVIMVSNVLNNPIRLDEVEEKNSSVIFLNPSIEDFRDFHYKEITIDDQLIKGFDERPETARLTLLLDKLQVHYILESTLVADLIQSSYTRYSTPIDTSQPTPANWTSHQVTLYTNEITTKRYSGTFPIVFELFKKDHLGKKGTFIGDGLGAMNSFNRVRSSIDMIDTPVVVKVSQPHTNFRKNLNEQLGIGEAETKKAIMLDSVRSVLRRVRVGQEIHFVCDLRTAIWLKEIPGLENHQIIKTDLNFREYRRQVKDGDIVEDDYPLLPLLHKKYVIASELKKARPALFRFIKQNSITDVRREKLISVLLLTITMAIRKGVNEDQPMHDFTFIDYWKDSMEPSGKYAKKLLTLCMDVIHEYANNKETLGKVVDRYKTMLTEVDSNYGSTEKST